MATVNVLLVGGPMDGQVVMADGPPSLLTYIVHREPSLSKPTQEDIEEGKTMTVVYQTHPFVGNTETWWIGRTHGMTFDSAISKILVRYNHTSIGKIK